MKREGKKVLLDMRKKTLEAFNYKNTKKKKKEFFEEQSRGVEEKERIGQN